MARRWHSRGKALSSRPKRQQPSGARAGGIPFRKLDRVAGRLRTGNGAERGGTAYEWFILAMIHHQRGDEAQGRTWFEKAVAWTREKSPSNLELRQLWSESAHLMHRPGPDATP